MKKTITYILTTLYRIYTKKEVLITDGDQMEKPKQTNQQLRDEKQTHQVKDESKLGACLNAD
jgi:hypothetical protein